MNYSKPEVSSLGTAIRVIEQTPQIKGPELPTDGAHVRVLTPAYDLDE